MQNNFEIVKTEDATDLPLPAYMTQASAGMDLYANVTEPVTLGYGEYQLIPTGIRIAMPPMYEAQVRPRSGLALRHGVTLLNSPGTIDADYRGEIKVILINHGQADFVIRRGDRIAQLVVCQFVQVAFSEVTELENTERGVGGFGHTGIH